MKGPSREWRLGSERPGRRQFHGGTRRWGHVNRPLAVVPNPFNPRTTVAYYVEKAGPVSVEVFDIRGRRVRILQQGDLPSGSHRVTWEGDDDRGSQVASGVYFLRLSTPTTQVDRRAVLVR